MDILAATQKIISKYDITVFYTIDMIDIFPKNLEEEKNLNKKLEKVSKSIIKDVRGVIYILNEGISTELGLINCIKIRNYDPNKKYRGAIDLLVEDFDKYKDSIQFNDNINYISNSINDFIEYDDYGIFLYIIKHSNIKAS
jgi:hypothetical protein